MTTTEFDKATDHEIKEADIEASRVLIGIDTPVTLQDHLTRATADAMANFARGYGDDNPLYTDETYGASTRWGAQIAPPMIVSSLNYPMKGDPLDPDLKARGKASFRGIHVFVSGGTYEWFRPIYPGDRLFSFGGTESVEVKESEFAGRSVQMVRRIVKVNQRAEVVCVNRLLAIYTERKKAREKGKYADIEPGRWTDESLAELDAIYAAERCRGPEPRYWEDVEVGEELRPLAKGPFTTTDVIVFHAGGYGFTPYAPCSNRLAYQNRQRIPAFYVKNDLGIPDVAQRVHWDSAWAQAIGNPMAYDYGVMRQTWLQHLVTDWMGDAAWLLRQSDEIRKFNYIGDAHVVCGKVVGKRTEGGRYYVDIETSAINQRGVITAPGKATVLLPSRAGGPVVLPDVPVELRSAATRMMERHWELSAGSGRTS